MVQGEGGASARLSYQLGVVILLVQATKHQTDKPSL